MTADSIKLNIIKTLLSLDNIELLVKVQSVLGISIAPNGQRRFDTEDYPVKVSFEEWNKQFEDGEDVDLDEFIPEYNMTLQQFRMMIWQGEQEEPMTLDEFMEDQKNWRK